MKKITHIDELKLLINDFKNDFLSINITVEKKVKLLIKIDSIIKNYSYKSIEGLREYIRFQLDFHRFYYGSLISSPDKGNNLLGIKFTSHYLFNQEELTKRLSRGFII